MARGLTKKQKVFIESYLRMWNATEAALEAGYSERSARSIGAENLTKPDIAEEIERRLAEMVMSADEALVRMTEQARAEYSEYIEVREGQAYVDLKRMKKDDKMHLVKSVKDTKYGQVIEFYDSQTALGNIAKHHKLLIDRHEVTGKDGGPIVSIYLPALSENPADEDGES